MITRTKQDWAVGKMVKVGFMQLEVVKAGLDFYDSIPDVYILKNSKGIYYEFIPHNGLKKCEIENGNIVGTYNYGSLS